MNTVKRPVAIVTGVGSPLGAAIVRKLIGRGFDIAAVDLRASWCDTSLGDASADRVRIRAFGADLRYLHEAEAMVLRVAEAMGPPSVVVNAPFPGRAGIVSELPEWESVVHARLRAPLLVSRAAERHLAASGDGRIVNVLQTGGTGRHRPDDLVIRETLRAMTETLAKELGPQGVVVNTIVTEVDCPTRTGESARDCCVVAEERTASKVEFLVSDAVDGVSGQMIESPHPMRTSTPARDTLR
ncbi:SDR family NAD(P)-dependent oxidoreductase [Antrihabitans cavernicola]|nr:SDR family oxidoreductase [Spelaeibacter cavernicola]